MEVRFVSIAAFRTALDSLLKVKKGVYASVPAEIESRIRIMDNVIRYLCVRQDA